MAKSPVHSVVLIPASITVLKSYLEKSHASVKTRWIYLGKNVKTSLLLNELTEGKIQRQNIAELLQEVANKKKQDYIDYIGRIGSSENKKCWWLTSLSEKNPFISNTFLYVCYLNVVAEIIEKEEAPDNLFIVCESDALIASLGEHLQSRENIHVEIIRASRLYSRFSYYTRQFRSITIFIARWICRCILSRAFRYLRRLSVGGDTIARENTVLIHSWADNRSFRDPGVYDDVFLGCLGRDLRNERAEVHYLIDFLPTCFFPLGLIKILRTGENALLMEEMINPIDVLKTVFFVMKQYPHLMEMPRFGEFDISALLNEEIQSDRTGIRPFQMYLYYLIGKKISRLYSVRAFIYSFENLIWEKMFCLAFRRYSPGTTIVGYAHSTISKMETFYSVSAYERGILPLPDWVVVNGPRARNVLISSGFDEDRILIGGAYRYHGLKTESVQRAVKKSVWQILIIPTDDFNWTLELLEKSFRAFGNDSRILCAVKLHPTFPKKKISQYIERMPRNFFIRDEPVDELLPLTDLVIYTGSTVAVEAIARGIPVLHVRSDLTIDRDIFDKSDNIISVATSEEIYREAVRIFHSRAESERRGLEFVREFFSPVQSDFRKTILAKPGIRLSEKPESIGLAKE